MKHNPFESQLEKLARTLTDRFGVTVTCRGESAYTDGKQIVLPSLPDPMDDALERMIVGYLDHEMAHVAFSDFGEVATFNQKYPGAEGMLNVVEDALIEKLAMQRWPGVRANLDALFNQVKRRVKSSMRKAHPFRRFCTAVYIKLSHHSDMLGLSKELFGFDDLLNEFPDVRTTADSAKLSAKLLKRWIQRQRSPTPTPEPPPQSRPSSTDQNDANSSREPQQPSGNGSKSDSKPDGTCQGDADPNQLPVDDEIADDNSQPENSEDDDLSNESDSSDSDVDAEESAEPESPAPKSPESARVESESEFPSSAGPVVSPSDESIDVGELRITGSMSGEADGDAEIDPAELATVTGGAGTQSQISTMVLESIEKAAKEIDGKDCYRVFTRQHDRIELVPKADDSAIAELLARDADIVRRLRRGLTNALRSAEKRWWRDEQPRGELSPRTLHRLCLDRPQLDVFRTRAVVQGQSAAVCLVLDASGSMTLSKMDVARAAVRALLESLHDLRIPTAAFTFTTGMAFDVNRASIETGSSPGNLLKRFGRVANLENGVIKQFDEPIKTALARLPTICGTGLTPLGEAMEIGARRLIVRRETRKILLIITDGKAGCEGSSQVCHEHALHVAKRITPTGIELVGVGIHEESLKEVIPDTIVVQELQDVPAQLCKLLGRTLKRGVCHVG
ncbi:MAG: VWA domain-containing protein [Planctomycetes bacterium]|nr:VWA domain-containing protein [Planctomycetota bacterium]